jgi:hypothetical protein
MRGYRRMFEALQHSGTPTQVASRVLKIVNKLWDDRALVQREVIDSQPRCVQDAGATPPLRKEIRVRRRVRPTDSTRLMVGAVGIEPTTLAPFPKFTECLDSN